MEWIRDQVVEKKLADLGAKWEFKIIKISSLLIEESKQNNARFKPIDDEQVLKYAVAMEGGMPFVGIVITPQHKILAGNHRVAAAIWANEKVIGAYVVKNGDQRMYDTFIRADNTRHGQGLDDEEAIQHCIHRHVVNGESLTDLNKEYFGGSTAKYQRLLGAWQANVVATHLSAEGVDVDKLRCICGRTALQRLHVLCPSEHGGMRMIRVLREAAQTAIKHRLGEGDVQLMVRSVKDTKSESEALEAIKEFSRQHGKALRSGPALPKRKEFLKRLSCLVNYLATGNDGHPFTSLAELEIEEEADQKAVSATIVGLCRSLREIKR